MKYGSSILSSAFVDRCDSGLRVVIMCCLLYLFSYFLRNSVAVIAPDIMAEQGFTSANISLISGSTMLAYGLMQLPSGILADAFGGRKVLMGLLGMAGLASLVMVFSPNSTTTVAARFFVGAGAAVYVPCMTLLAASLPTQRYAAALGFMNASGGFGGILAATPMVLLSQAVGWRGAVLASVLVAFGLLGMVILSRSGAAEHLEKDANSTPGLKGLLDGMAEVLKDARFWPFCLWQMTTIGTSFMLLTLWWIPYLTDGAGFSRVEASGVITLASIVLLVAPPCTALVSNALRSRKIPMIVLSLGCLTSALIWMFLTEKMTLGMHLALAVLFAISTSGGGILNFTMVRETFPIRVLGTASGCVNMIYPVWSALLQGAFGLVLGFRLASGDSPQAAYSWAFWIVGANMLVACVCALRMKETFSRERE